jgi:hypothetical protein
MRILKGKEGGIEKFRAKKHVPQKGGAKCNATSFVVSGKRPISNKEAPQIFPLPRFFSLLFRIPNYCFE